MRMRTAGVCALFVTLLLGACGAPAEDPVSEVLPVASVEQELPMETTTSAAPETTTTATPTTAAPATTAAPPPTTAQAVVATSAAPAPAPAQPPTTAAPTVYFKNCTEARDAGAAPVRRGDPGYGSHLDRDGDGVGCE